MCTNKSDRARNAARPPANDALRAGDTGQRLAGLVPARAHSRHPAAVQPHGQNVLEALDRRGSRTVEADVIPRDGQPARRHREQLFTTPRILPRCAINPRAHTPHPFAAISLRTREMYISRSDASSDHKAKNTTYSAPMRTASRSSMAALPGRAYVRRAQTAAPAGSIGRKAARASSPRNAQRGHADKAAPKPRKHEHMRDDQRDHRAERNPHQAEWAHEQNAENQVHDRVHERNDGKRPVLCHPQHQLDADGRHNAGEDSDSQNDREHVRLARDIHQPRLQYGARDRAHEQRDGSGDAHRNLTCLHIDEFDASGILKTVELRKTGISASTACSTIWRAHRRQTVRHHKRGHHGRAEEPRDNETVSVVFQEVSDLQPEKGEAVCGGSADKRPVVSGDGQPHSRQQAPDAEKAPSPTGE